MGHTRCLYLCLWRADGTETRSVLAFDPRGCCWSGHCYFIRWGGFVFSSENEAEPGARANAYGRHASCGAGGAPAVGAAHLYRSAQKMNTRFCVVAVLLLLSACGRGPAITGAFVSEEPFGTSDKNMVFQRVEFYESGFVALSNVDSEGRIIGAVTRAKYTVHGRRISFRSQESDTPKVPVIFCFPDLTVESADRLRADVSRSWMLIRDRRKEPNQAPEPTPTSVTPPARQEARQP